MDASEVKRKTNKEVIEFLTRLGKSTPNRDSLLEAAKRRTIKNAREFVEDYRDKVDTVNRDHCITDPETKAIIRDGNKDYMFTAQGEVQRRDAIKKLLKEPCLKPFEIIQTFDTAGLERDEIEDFMDFGFIMSEQEYKSRYQEKGTTNENLLSTETQ